MVFPAVYRLFRFPELCRAGLCRPLPDELLYNIYKMGRNSIDRGSRDNWTLSPKRIAEMGQLYADAPKTGGTRTGTRQGLAGARPAGADSTRKAGRSERMGVDSARANRGAAQKDADSAMGAGNSKRMDIPPNRRISPR